jgi:hypothetical protein
LSRLAETVDRVGDGGRGWGREERPGHVDEERAFLKKNPRAPEDSRGTGVAVRRGGQGCRGVDIGMFDAKTTGFQSKKRLFAVVSGASASGSMLESLDG